MGAFPRLGRIALRLGIRYFDTIVCGNHRHTPPFSHPLPNMISCFVSTKNLSFRQANNPEHRRTGFLTGFTSFLKMVEPTSAALVRCLLAKQVRLLIRYDPVELVDRLGVEPRPRQCECPMLAATTIGPWWNQGGLNSRPSQCHCDVLPTEL